MMTKLVKPKLVLPNFFMGHKFNSFTTLKFISKLYALSYQQFKNVIGFLNKKKHELLQLRDFRPLKLGTFCNLLLS